MAHSHKNLCERAFFKVDLRISHIMDKNKRSGGILMKNLIKILCLTVSLLIIITMSACSGKTEDTGVSSTVVQSVEEDRKSVV